MERIVHSDGRIVIDQDNGERHLQYRIGDHLNNTVASFEDKNGDGILQDPEEILVKKLYYPFGMALEGVLPDTTTPPTRFLYNNKEFEEEGGVYFYGARLYAPVIGRFAGVDPLAEQFANQSPYLYAYNNPILFVDVYGLYGDEKDANKQRDAAIARGEEVGEVYQSGDEWGFNVVNGEDSYSSFSKDYYSYKQVNESTMVKYVPGSTAIIPEYTFIYPQDFGDWGQAGSDGLIWKGCLACHAENGAYRYAAYNSQEAWNGRAIAATILAFSPAVLEAGAIEGGILNPKNYQLLKKPLVFRNVGLKSGLGETTFQIGLRYKPTNTMIRLERHSANLIGGGRTYYTHFNTLPVSRLNHFGLNPLKWGTIKY